MTDADSDPRDEAEEVLYIASSCNALKAGQRVTVFVSQTLMSDSPAMQASGSVYLHVNGSNLRLQESDITGCFPANGTSSPGSYLPHVALSRRTLPWERAGIANGQLKTPWLALLLFSESELLQKKVQTGVQVNALPQEARPSGSTDQLVDIIEVDAQLLARILPTPDEIALLCHVRRQVPHNPTLTNPLGPIKDASDCAVVIGNRLPNVASGERQVACLVSLENRGDLPWPARGRAPVSVPSSKKTLVVLYHWSFMTDPAGDFESVMQAIRVAPNGGCLRYGERPVPAASALTTDGSIQLEHHTLGTPVTYRGPLCPHLPPTRSGELALREAREELDAARAKGAVPNYAYAAAFELGRLLTLADDGLLSDLQSLRTFRHFRVFDLVGISEMPAALQKKDWVSDPNLTAQWSDRWGAVQNDLTVSRAVSQLQLLTPADIGALKWFVPQELQSRIDIQQAPQHQGSQTHAVLDLEHTTGAELDHAFPMLRVAGR